MQHSTILDQPFEEQQIKPVKRGWTWFEMILAPVVIALVIIREITGLLWAFEGINFTGVILGLGYLFGYYWIDRPPLRSARTIVFSILYGLFFFGATFAFIALILFMPGGKEASWISAGLLAITLAGDFIASINKSRVASYKTFTRLAVFAVVFLVLNVIPEKIHVPFVYRSYPGFVAYYNEHQQDGRFLNILYDYKINNNIPAGELK